MLMSWRGALRGGGSGSGEPSGLPSFYLRDRTYARSMRLYLAASIAAHAFLLIGIGTFIEEPAQFKIIGYEGPVRLLSELSILQEQEAAVEQLRSQESATMKMVAFETDQGKTSREPVTKKEPVKEIDFSNRLMEASMKMTAGSPPQPRSDALVIRRLVKPRYPATSLANGVEGKVVLKIHVTKEGKVENAIVIESEVDEFCERAAIDAALQCEFKPFEYNGRPVDFWLRFPIRFELEDYFLHGPPSEETESGSKQ